MNGPFVETPIDAAMKIVFDGDGNRITYEVWNGGISLAKYAPTGLLLWARTYSAHVLSGDLDVDSAGDIVISGSCSYDVVVGPVHLDCPDKFYVGTGYFLKFDSQGNPLWGHLTGGDVGPSSIAIDPVSDDIYIGNPGPVDYGSGPIALPSFSKFDPMGNHLWTLTSTGSKVLVGVDVVGASGDVAFSGRYWGSPQLGGVALPASPSGRAIAGKVSSDGVLVDYHTDQGVNLNDSMPYWFPKSILDGDESSFTFLVVEENATPVDLACGCPTLPGVARSCIVKRDPQGSCLWVMPFPYGASPNADLKRVVGPNGDLYVTVSITDPAADFGGGPLGVVGRGAARFDGATGALSWFRVWPHEWIKDPLRVGAGGESTWWGTVGQDSFTLGTTYLLDLPP